MYWTDASLIVSMSDINLVLIIVQVQLSRYKCLYFWLMFHVFQTFGYVSTDVSSGPLYIPRGVRL